MKRSTSFRIAGAHRPSSRSRPRRSRSPWRKPRPRWRALRKSQRDSAEPRRTAGRRRTARAWRAPARCNGQRYTSVPERSSRWSNMARPAPALARSDDGAASTARRTADAHRRAADPARSSRARRPGRRTPRPTLPAARRLRRCSASRLRSVKGRDTRAMSDSASPPSALGAARRGTRRRRALGRASPSRSQPAPPACPARSARGRRDRRGQRRPATTRRRRGHTRRTAGARCRRRNIAPYAGPAAHEALSRAAARRRPRSPRPAADRRKTHCLSDASGTGQGSLRASTRRRARRRRARAAWSWRNDGNFSATNPNSQGWRRAQQ